MANKPNFKMENGPIVLISGWSFDFLKRNKSVFVTKSLGILSTASSISVF